jgi:hypothetical protein
MEQTRMRVFLGALIPAGMIGLILGAAAMAPASAVDKSQNISPGHAQTIDLGYVHGVAYYTPERDGYQVVATLSIGGGAPVRVTATLQPEQHVSFSVPAEDGADVRQIELYRRGDVVTLSQPARLVLN